MGKNSNILISVVLASGAQASELSQPSLGILKEGIEIGSISVSGFEDLSEVVLDSDMIFALELASRSGLSFETPLLSIRKSEPAVFDYSQYEKIMAVGGNTSTSFMGD